MKKLLKILTATMLLGVVALTVVGCSNENNDKGFVGKLFCSHKYNDGEVTLEATCKDLGELTKTCTKCGKTKTEELELIEHTPIIVSAKDPTCVEAGHTDGTKCSVCDEPIVPIQEIPAYGHNKVKIPEVAPGCLTDGLTEGEYCVRCNETITSQEKIAAKGHVLVNVAEKTATCGEKGHSAYSYCSECGTMFGYEEYLSTGNHEYNNSGLCLHCNEFDVAQYFPIQVSPMYQQLKEGEVFGVSVAYTEYGVFGFKKTMEEEPEFLLHVTENDGVYIEVPEIGFCYIENGDVGSFGLVLDDERVYIQNSKIYTINIHTSRIDNTVKQTITINFGEDYPYFGCEIGAGVYQVLTTVVEE